MKEFWRWALQWSRRLRAVAKIYSEEKTKDYRNRKPSTAAQSDNFATTYCEISGRKFRICYSGRLGSLHSAHRAKILSLGKVSLFGRKKILLAKYGPLFPSSGCCSVDTKNIARVKID